MQSKDFEITSDIQKQMQNLDMTEADELQKKFQRDINCLLDEDRNIRRSGLNNIRSGIFAAENKPEVVQTVFERGLLKNLLRVLEDKVEKHRDLTIAILQNFIIKVPCIDNDLVSSILKALFTRLNVLPFPEQGEEMRLQIIKLIRLVVNQGSGNYAQAFTWNIAEFSNTVSKVLTDNYADAKKEGSLLLIDASKRLNNVLGDHAGVVVKSLIKNLSHQHSKVRKITLEAASEILLTRGAGNQLREMLPAIKIIVNDKTMDCRRTCYQMLGSLLNKLPETVLTDYEPELVRYLINGLSDDNQEVIILCKDLVSEIGKNLQGLSHENMEIEKVSETVNSE